MGLEKPVVEDDVQAASTRKTVMGNSQQLLIMQLSNNLLQYVCQGDIEYIYIQTYRTSFVRIQ